METQIWKLALGLVLVGFGLDVRNAAAESPQTDVRLTVHVCNYADVDSKTLASAERGAKEIFRKAGVQSRWIDAHDRAQKQSDNSTDVGLIGLSQIWLDILSPATVAHLGLADSFMGFAPGTGPNRNVVKVFYNRVTELGERQSAAWAHGMISRNVSAGQILGAVMAHEIGHVLLNLSSHSEIGIMRGDWDQEDLYKVGAGCLLFTPNQAEVIRAELLRRAVEREAPGVAKTAGPVLLH